MDLGAGLFGREILPERAAEADVEELAAAADAEEGQPAPNRLVGKGELPGVAPEIDLAELRMVRFTITRRSDILSAAEEDHVNAVQEGGTGGDEAGR